MAKYGQKSNRWFKFFNEIFKHNGWVCPYLIQTWLETEFSLRYGKGRVSVRIIEFWVSGEKIWVMVKNKV